MKTYEVQIISRELHEDGSARERTVTSQVVASDVRAARKLALDMHLEFGMNPSRQVVRYPELRLVVTELLAT